MKYHFKTSTATPLRGEKVERMEQAQQSEYRKEIIRYDDMGYAVIKEELTGNGQFFKITTKSFEELTEYDYYESSYDRGYIGNQTDVEAKKITCADCEHHICTNECLKKINCSGICNYFGSRCKCTSSAKKCEHLKIWWR